MKVYLLMYYPDYEDWETLEGVFFERETAEKKRDELINSSKGVYQFGAKKGQTYFRLTLKNFEIEEREVE